MIKRFEVIGLNGKIGAQLVFNHDLNIVTGKNGSGKTSLLKLLWYLVSGNLERVFPEILFDELSLETDAFAITIRSQVDRKARQYLLAWSFGDDAGTKELSHEALERSGDIQRLNRKIVTVSKSSVFFPTFRRIEGGFSIARRAARRETRQLVFYAAPTGESLQHAMAGLSDELSVAEHRFVSSISTNDIVELITKQYADVSEQTNSSHAELSTFITERIRAYSAQQRDRGTSDAAEANSVLQEIQIRVDEVSRRREELLKPFLILSDLIATIFKDKAIRVTDAITLGEAADAIASDKLSAGEKQMLSFLCYNAFSRNSMVFIDEPEISLHVDWQRMLFPTLLEQSTGNQFIVATHSPFIYSKYPDKELVLDPDRGGE